MLNRDSETTLLPTYCLGLNQGLAWSMTVNMKIDLVGRKRRVTSKRNCYRRY